MKIKRFKEKVFSVGVTLIYNCSAIELENYFKKKKVTFEGNIRGSSGATFEIEEDCKDGGVFTTFYIWVIDKNDFYSLSHECIHLVKYIFSAHGVPINKENDEIFAIYHTYWLKKLWHSIKYSKKK